MKDNRDELAKWVSVSYLQEKKLELLRLDFNKAKPFAHLVLAHFFSDEVIKRVISELEKQKFTLKDSDLFTLYQTSDFSSTILNGTFLQRFQRFLGSKEFISYLENLSSMRLRVGKVDAAGALYTKGCYLLAHDDRLEGRRIAYILYLSNLQSKDGGGLVLYSAQDGIPIRVADVIKPARNTLILFEVSEASFHEVKEVLNDADRLAIGGWFYER